MHQVSKIYTDLVGLVDDQQEDIDQLEENAYEARVIGEAAAEEIGCLYQREQACGGGLDVPTPSEEDVDLFAFRCSDLTCGNTMDFICHEPPNESLDVSVEDDGIEIERIVEPPKPRFEACSARFSGCSASYKEHMETFKEDMAHVRQELMVGIKSFLDQSKRLHSQCGALSY
jgi:hypothetical protein